MAILGTAILIARMLCCVAANIQAYLDRRH